MSDFVKIAEYRDLPIAELAKSKLDSENVPCYLTNKHHVGMNWLYSQALGGVALYVRHQDEKRANLILNTDESDLITGLEDHFPEPDKADICEKCGSTNLSYINRSRFFGAISLLFGMPFILFGVRYKCRECGHTMKPPK